MTDGIPLSRFHARTDLPDWRVLLTGIEATYRTASFDQSVGFVQEITAGVSGSSRPPDVDLRHPDLVHVTVPASPGGGLDAADVELASRISAAAAAAGVRSEPGASTRLEVAIDALDIDAVRPFWQAVLGYDEEPASDGGQVTALVDPARIGPTFWFQQMDAPRPQRNRIHIDVTVAHDLAEARVAEALEAGGRLVTDDFARSFWVLADAEGNEACVCTWQDRS
jgi:4a-hydroxytetrahydrobiopterin dehydratase